MPKKIHNVVSGIFLRDDKFLVEKRRIDDESDPGYIEIPGGHVEDGEPLQKALKREMKKELGVDVLRATMVHKDLYTASNGERQRIHYFVIKDWRGMPKSKEAERVYWEDSINNLSIIPDKRGVGNAIEFAESYNGR